MQQAPKTRWLKFGTLGGCRSRTMPEQLSPEFARAAIDPLFWLQHHTRTRDSHWREAGANSPYRPFPDKSYFAQVIDTIQNEPVLFIEKSRDMMISWLCGGYFTHAAMTNQEREVLFQSQKEAISAKKHCRSRAADLIRAVHVEVL